MDVLQQFVVQTPFWVWIILVWLIWRGIAARRPGDTNLLKMAVVPIVFTAWGLYDLMTLYGVATDTAGYWLAGIVIGAIAGWWLAARLDITVDRAAGVMRRPADYSLLPLFIVTFLVKYVFGVLGAVDPSLLAQTGFKIADLGSRACSPASSSASSCATLGSGTPRRSRPPDGSAAGRSLGGRHGRRVDLDDVAVRIEHVELQEAGEAPAQHHHLLRVVAGRVLAIAEGHEPGERALEIFGHEGEVHIGDVDRGRGPERAVRIEQHVQLQVAAAEPGAFDDQRRPLEPRKAEHTLVERQRAVEVARDDRNVMQ